FDQKYTSFIPKKICIAFRFYANCAFQLAVEDVSFDIQNLVCHANQVSRNYTLSISHYLCRGLSKANWLAVIYYTWGKPRKCPCSQPIHRI
ncbi:hypothetical protein X975_10486, partial [Stegodyphus mimosarum]